MNRMQMQQNLINTFHQHNYYPANINQIPRITLQMPVVHNANITVSFPGYKSRGRNSYDYLVQLNGASVAHLDIMHEIYGQIINNPGDAQVMENLLIDISNNWENINLAPYRGLNFTFCTLEGFVECICYISIQEEINYPSTSGYDGYKRPFYSYLEALYSAIYNNPAMFQASLARCKANARLVWLPDPNIPYASI